MVSFLMPAQTDTALYWDSSLSSDVQKLAFIHFDLFNLILQWDFLNKMNTFINILYLYCFFSARTHYKYSTFMLQNIYISNKCCSFELCIHKKNYQKIYQFTKIFGNVTVFNVDNSNVTILLRRVCVIKILHYLYILRYVFTYVYFYLHVYISLI